jgi:hypothetical protein
MQRSQRGADALNDRPEATDHRQVRIEHEGMSALVDEGIAGLIVQLWRAGFHTTGSCQQVFGHDDVNSVAWIMFATPEEAKAFARLSGGTVMGLDSVVARKAPYYVNKAVTFPPDQMHAIKKALRKQHKGT